MYDWMYDDITWCGETECENTSCRRHLNNRSQKEGMFSMSILKGTGLCPLKDLEHKEVSIDDKQ